MDTIQWRQELASVDTDVLSSDECASLVVELAKLGKACDALRARAAAKAANGLAHSRRGFADAAEWLATATGTTAAEAKRSIAAVEGLGACPTTEQAWRSGQISSAQAAEIVKTEAVRPGSETDLLRLARSKPLRALKEQAELRRLTAIDPDELRRRQHKARHVRHWRDEIGMIRISGAFEPEVGAALFSRIDRAAERGRREARRAGHEESWEAHAADALVSLVTRDGEDDGPSRLKSDVVFVCDINAYRRGHIHQDEVCHAINGGPVPVDIVKEAVENDAFLKVAFHDGIEIHTIKHFGRHIRAALRTALEIGPPPHFLGARCGCGCARQYKLQIDHIDPVAHGGATEKQNLQPLVPTEHAAKTRRDREAGLLHTPP